MKSIVLSALLLLAAGCTAARYTLTKRAGRDLLLPPGVRAPKASSEPDTGCGGTNPVTPRASHYSLYGCYIQNGYVDLQPEMRLKIIRPVVAGGGTLRVEVSSQSEQDRTLTVKTNATGVETKIVKPQSLGLGAGIVHYRLFFLARNHSGKERKATLIGAASLKALEDASANLDEYCGHPEATCLIATDGMAIAPMIPVDVEGKLEYVPLGATVRELLPADIRTPNMLRRWKGNLVEVRTKGPVAPPLASLPLNGGDHVFW